MRASWAIAVCLAVAAPAFTGDEARTERPRPQPLAFYTFAELLDKAERIVLAEVGPAQEGRSVLLVRETLKAPENDAKYLETERLKRAAELLGNDKLDPSPPKLPARIKAVAEDLRLPPEGTQAVFFLWERAAGEGQTEPAYRLAHPQCIYDSELLPQVRAGVGRPRSVADGRYLREWDKQMAARARQRQANEGLLKMQGGETVRGLRLRALRPALSLRRDNSFSVTARVENARGRDQLLYNGPGGGYGVLLRPKNGEAGAGVVLRQTAGSMGADSAVLNLPDITDFATVQGEAFLAKELFFDAKEHLALRGLDGEYTVAVFLSSEQDGRGLELTAPVWTGTLVSEEAPLRFVAQPKPARIPEP